MCDGNLPVVVAGPLTPKSGGDNYRRASAQCVLSIGVSLGMGAVQGLIPNSLCILREFYRMTEKAAQPWGHRLLLTYRPYLSGPRMTSPTVSRLLSCTSPNHVMKPCLPLPWSTLMAIESPRSAPACGLNGASRDHGMATS